MTSRKSAKPQRRVLRDWWVEGRAEFPGGPPTDLPQPGKVKPRGRGQPPKTTAGSWEDDDLLAEVSRIIGTLRDREYYADDAEFVNDMLDGLCRLARRALGQTLTQDQKDELKRLAFGGIGKRSGTRKRAATASDITRQLLVWRHHVTDPDVRRMQRSLRKGRPRVKMIFR